ncbi:cuticle protein 10.9-like protein [Leptotrombidium deliense]|uniref:Cuticle protein 10.9-like protein n=1 Tax=Leptotrombidium deliense TaxID=299467 RepID=A0A443S7Y4_9ACAR|nr:cuticle protein 10.9-like protein [Leptotrombidium deliense]
MNVVCKLHFVIILLVTAVACQYSDYSEEDEEGSYGRNDALEYGSQASAKQNGYKQNYEEQYVCKPQPYNFEYKVDDNYGNSHYQKEEGDDYGNKRGSYGYMDAFGVYREVEYVADENGFRATIKTNEPGTSNASPADVMMHAEEPPAKVNPGSGSASASYKADNYASQAQSEPQSVAFRDKRNYRFRQPKSEYSQMNRVIADQYRGAPQRAYSFQRPSYAKPHQTYKQSINRRNPKLTYF